jgi:K+ transporter
MMAGPGDCQALPASRHLLILVSPLYVFSSTFVQPPTPSQVIEVLSVIIWALTLMVTVKYVFIILHADNEGEGGTFSCYSLLTRFVRTHTPLSLSLSSM